MPVSTEVSCSSSSSLLSKKTFLAYSDVASVGQNVNAPGLAIIEGNQEAIAMLQHSKTLKNLK